MTPRPRRSSTRDVDTKVRVSDEGLGKGVARVYRERSQYDDVWHNPSTIQDGSRPQIHSVRTLYSAVPPTLTNNQNLHPQSPGFYEYLAARQNFYAATMISTGISS